MFIYIINIFETIEGGGFIYKNVYVVTNTIWKLLLVVHKLLISSFSFFFFILCDKKSLSCKFFLNVYQF